MATWACWPAKIRWPSSKTTTLQSRATGNANAATVAALAASTRKLLALTPMLTYIVIHGS